MFSASKLATNVDDLEQLNYSLISVLLKHLHLLPSFHPASLWLPYSEPGNDVCRLSSCDGLICAQSEHSPGHAEFSR